MPLTRAIIAGIATPPEHAQIDVEILSRPDEALRHADTWRRWAEERGNAFLTPEWYELALAHYPDAGEPAVVVVYAEGDLRGVLPFVSTGRRLRFGGTQIGDWFAPLCEQGDEVAVVAAAAKALSADPRSRSIVLDNVVANDPWWRPFLAQGGPRGGKTAIVYRDDVMPRLEFGGLDWDGYLATRSKNLRGQVRRKSRKTLRELEVTYRLSDTASVDADLESFFTLHEQRWGEQGGSHALTLESRAFHREFAHRARGRGWLRLWTMEVGDEPIASWYGWRLGASYCYYLAGFSPDHRDHSIGLVLLAHTMAAAAEEGAEVYDFLMGDEPYKSRFATHEEPVHTVMIVPKVHHVRALAGIDAVIWRAGQHIPEGWRAPAHKVYRALSPLLPGGRGQ